LPFRLSICLQIKGSAQPLFTLYIKVEYRLELACKDSSLVGHYPIRGTKQGKNLGLKDLSKC